MDSNRERERENSEKAKKEKPDLLSYSAQIRFFKHSEWQYVTIDDRIPTNGQRPLYGRCKDDNEQWVALVEKAYAKLHGCYEVIESGNISVALTDLTSESCSTFEFADADVVNAIKDGSMWKQMQWFQKEEYLMGCSAHSESEKEEEMPLGLMKNHAYGILSV
jgi:hypothetical protein